MARGSVFAKVGRVWTDPRTGAEIRQLTAEPCIHHHPFFFVPAYDDLMVWLFFISWRSGRPEIHALERTSGRSVQLTDQTGIDEWSLHPDHAGRFVYFTARGAAWRVGVEDQRAECLADLGAGSRRARGMVGAGMGVTALDPTNRFWAVPHSVGAVARLSVIDLEAGGRQDILERDVIGHPQFCPDDPGLLFYAGPMTDRLWLLRRDGTGHRRLHAGRPGEWITHESWLPGHRALAFVSWPHGIWAVGLAGERPRPIATLNAWHAVADRRGRLMVADTNAPDIGLQLLPLAGGRPRTLCHPGASNAGAHWHGPFPYGHGSIAVHAPQHTHPHPAFSPDGRHVVFTSDAGGWAQVHEVTVPEDLLGAVVDGRRTI